MQIVVGPVRQAAQSRCGLWWASQNTCWRWVSEQRASSHSSMWFIFLGMGTMVDFFQEFPVQKKMTKGFYRQRNKTQLTSVTCFFIFRSTVEQSSSFLLTSHYILDTTEEVFFFSLFNLFWNNHLVWLAWSTFPWSSCQHGMIVMKLLPWLQVLHQEDVVKKHVRIPDHFREQNCT